MEIKDLSWNEVISKRFNHPLLPRSIRGIIVGKSGCGKTTLLLNLLLRPCWLDYDNLFIFGKSLFQPEYRILKTAFEEELPKEYILRLFNIRDEIQNSQIPPSLVVKEWAKTIKKKSDIRCNFFESASDVPDPRELSSEDKNLMVFDDLLLEKQKKSYYVKGRHSNVDCFYLAQNYFKLPRQTIRENHQNSLAKVLGFTGAKYTEGFHESENVVDILRINSILINIDIISGSYVNGTTKSTILFLFSRCNPGYKIIESPVNLVYLPITLDTIDSLNVTITDQDYHLLNLRNEKLTIRFHIREAR